ncbi:MAG: DUF523 domain-containing protein [Eubacteriales bacterium]
MNILISACLLGMACRYDGQSKRQPDPDFCREDIHLIPVCPESEGGLSTPRPPSERRGDRVVNVLGQDVTDAYRKGAAYALELAKRYGCRYAILKERSPSCGHGQIYDGSFTGRLVSGNGVCAELLEQNGITVIGESQAEAFLSGIGKPLDNRSEGRGG